MTTSKRRNEVRVSPEIFRLSDLAKRGKLSPSSIRYYISIGLLSKAHGTTFGAYYDAVHLRELADIKYWQRRGLTLAEIRVVLGAGGVQFPVRELREGEGKDAELVLLIGDSVEIRCRTGSGPIERTLAKRVFAWARFAAKVYEDELSADRQRKPRPGA